MRFICSKCIELDLQRHNSGSEPQWVWAADETASLSLERRCDASHRAAACRSQLASAVFASFTAVLKCNFTQVFYSSTNICTAEIFRLLVCSRHTVTVGDTLHSEVLNRWWGPLSDGLLIPAPLFSDSDLKMLASSDLWEAALCSIMKLTETQSSVKKPSRAFSASSGLQAVRSWPEITSASFEYVSSRTL